ncbi:hypothetical protein BLNAU_22411 [Blattamonas nauphoetae]|uniref:Uncharacterized protein n=1 Tax=Blattamonas nauphoetae TaxID=2049346 RepID=A0ABQ9WU86_9EUKA|nr:hypothetical protein BLNAU_22411 [Blattamonas nauphoetae]
MKVFREKLMAMPFFFINYASYLDEGDPNWDVYLMYKKTKNAATVQIPHVLISKLLAMQPCTASSIFLTLPCGESVQSSNHQGPFYSLRLSQEQLQRCYFIFRWRILDQKNAELVKDFRVDVTWDLYLKHEEELAGLEQSERMAKLDLLYQIRVTEMRMSSSCFYKHLDFIEQGVWNPPDE